MRRSFVIVTLMVMWPTLLAQQIFTNDSILKMVRMGFSDEVILNSINHSPGAYDTSVDGLIGLKKAGVSNSIMAAIVRKTDGEQQVKPGSVPPSKTVPTTAPVAGADQVLSAPVIAPPPAPPRPAATPVIVTEDSIGQPGPETAKRIYAKSQNSVFLIYLNDSSGTPSALGSAFLIAPRTLVTNAHVADAGEPFLAIGPVRIPLTLVSKDEKDDLAVLSSETDLTSRSLALATDNVAPGEEIFAIGNPEGLEKTISEGIISGIRNDDGRQLLQITSPISHGSSGGPILNRRGEVVGVAVGMMENGQNLNFAVPVAYLKALLDRKAGTSSQSLDLSVSITGVDELIRQRGQDEFSTDSSSPYQTHTQKLIGLINEITAAPPRREVLTQEACWGTTSFDLSDMGIKAAKTLVKVSPSSDSRALLAYVLYDRSQNEQITSSFAVDGSPEKAKAQAAYDHFLAEAENTVQGANAAEGTQSASILTFVSAAVKDDRGQLTDAIRLNALLTTSKLTFCGSDLTQKVLRSLIFENNRAHKPDEAEKWFRRYASLYQPEPYEWDSEGDRRRDANDPQLAADAYERAASASKSYAYDYCYASAARKMQGGQIEDAVLSDGRQCIAASVEQTGKEDQKEFAHELPFVYRMMADVLETRGVYQQAMEYVKESLTMQPGNTFALDTEAVLFEDLEQYSECISAEQSAIRASDGKYSWMHFRLGNCYFESKDWNHAEASFRIAAQANKSDAVSAYNLGLSLARQGYSADAAQWFREALSRNPDSEMRSKILAAVQ